MRDRKIPYDVKPYPSRFPGTVPTGRAVWYALLFLICGFLLGNIVGSEIAFKSVRAQLLEVARWQGETGVLAEQAAESCARADSILSARPRR